MFSLRDLFRRNSNGKTVRNSYLDDHGYYLAMAKGKPVNINGHSAPSIPYAIADIIKERSSKDMSIYVRWDIFSYRWALRNFLKVSSCRVSMEKKLGKSHRHFVRDGEVSDEKLAAFIEKHSNKFDIILFDGPDKKTAVAGMFEIMKKNGVVVLIDDFNDPYDYDQAVDFFKSKNMKILQITNPSPLCGTLTAALIYGEENVFDL